MYLLICICALFGVLFIPGIFLVTEDDVMERVFGLQKWGCFVIMLYKVYINKYRVFTYE
jgi:multisubunit Na+/H+ antiporter MnhC subunit